MLSPYLIPQNGASCYYSCETKIPLSQSEDLTGVTKLLMVVKVVVSWIVPI